MSVRLSRRSSYSRTSRRTDYSVAPTGSVLHSKSFICKLAGWGKLEPRLDSSAAVGRFFGPVPLFWTDKPNRHVEADGGARLFVRKITKPEMLQLLPCNR